MNRREFTIVAGAVSIIVAAALFLLAWDKRQHLGKPGVRVVNSPMDGIDISREGTNTFVAGSNSVYLPAKVLAFDSQSSPITKIVWDWLPKDTTYGQRIYKASDGFEIQAMAVLMGKDRTSIHQPQYCLTGAGWLTQSQEPTVIGMDKPIPYELPVMKMKLRKTYRGSDGQEREAAAVLVYWFVADNQLTADHRQRMWWMARDLLRSGVLQRWAYVLQFSICRTGEEEAAFARISEFIRASVPEFQLVPAGPGTLASIPAERREVTD